MTSTVVLRVGEAGWPLASRSQSGDSDTAEMNAVGSVGSKQ